MVIAIERSIPGTPWQPSFSGSESITVAPGSPVTIRGCENGQDHWVDVRWRDLAGLRLVSDSEVEILKRDGSSVVATVRTDTDSPCSISVRTAIETGGGRSAAAVSIPLAGATAVTTSD